jgi:restriction system protein
MWMVRSPGGEYATELLSKGLIGIGWGEAGSELPLARTPEDFYAIVRKHWPDYKPQQIINAGRQLYKFFREIKTGDKVLTYDSPRRTYHLGTVTSAAESNPDLIEHLSNFRHVNWQGEIGRDRLSLTARNSLGSTLTLFRPSEETITEIEKLVVQPAYVSAPEEPVITEAEDPFANASANSRELIKDRLMKLSWQDMQTLVAGILRAMGYKTKVSAEGSDRGKDIVASPDGLGLEQPRIFVEVKHRKGQQMGAPEVRKFIGGRDHQNDRCLYVSTGGFTTEAKYEAERAKVPLTLIDSDELVELLIEYYERTDTELRTLVPLRKTYWPV